MLTKEERQKQYRAQWAKHYSGIESFDFKTVETLAARLNPWAGHQSIHGYAYNESTEETRGIFCAAKAYLFAHEKPGHSPTCLENYWYQLDTVMEVGAAIEKYGREYPNHCRQCGGVGYIHNPGVYMYPDGSGEPPSNEPCEGCTGVGECPLCGHEHDEDWDAEACELCAWTWDKPVRAPAWEQAGALECTCGDY